MFIIDPDNPGGAAGDAPPADTAADIMAAMDQGIEEATPESPQPQDPPAPQEGEPAGGQPPGTQNAGDPQNPDGATPPAAEDDPEKKAAAEEEAKIAEEVKALGLKEKSEARFRELIGQVKELAPLRDAMEKAGIKDIADLPKMAERAKAADDMIEMVTSTGATAEQYGKSLDYLAAISAATKGDAKAADAAWDMLMGEVKELAAALGKEVPGVFDPIAEHADLVQQVKDGDMPRERAIEVANARRMQAALQQQQRAQAQQAQQQQAEAQRAQAGAAALQQWEADKLQDPRYMQLRPELSKEVAKIRQQHPPEMWATLTGYAYDALLARAAAPAQQPKPPMGPVRPTGPQPTMVPQFDDPAAALDFGLKQAG